jgi:hypothetical protein
MSSAEDTLKTTPFVHRVVTSSHKHTYMVY